MNIFRLFKSGLSLRLVNVAGLSVVFASMVVSAGYIKRELSYDRHHTESHRIVRLTSQTDDLPVDGRIWGNGLDDLLEQVPEIEKTAKMRQVGSAILTSQGESRIVNNFYQVNRHFLQVFDLPLVEGYKEEALQQSGQVLISESFAKQLFGDKDIAEVLHSELSIESQWLGDSIVFVSGIFKDVPQTSHFQTDILLHLPEEGWAISYTYLLLKEHTDIDALSMKMNQLIQEREESSLTKTRLLLMPLTDIHLHSHNLREMSVNGNITYIWLIIGANLLLLTVALFNLWLNANLIFIFHRRYYQLLRLHGAPPSVVFKDELFLALLLGAFSIVLGLLLLLFGKFPVLFSPLDIGLWTLLFLSIVVAVSLFPLFKSLSSTLFLNTNHDVRPLRFSYKNVQFMLTAQYAVVMVVVILAFGIYKQMNLVKDSQVGGDDPNILVLKEQPWQMQMKYAQLKSELLKYPQIEAVTASF